MTSRPQKTKKKLTRKQEISAFRALVREYYKKSGRHDLPWRTPALRLKGGVLDPYAILVSEVMLQQTQVPRVIEKFKEFLSVFPTVETLAQAPLARVLKHWSGLGYNRRARFLHEAAKAIVREHTGIFPKEKVALEQLPGVGRYTAGAVRVFAFNRSDTLIETNVRTVFIHHFFPGAEKVPDNDLLPYITEAEDGQEPRTWYWALMDYGAYLKQAEGNAARRSRHYARQSAFKGSLREARGAILRALHGRAKTAAEMVKDTGIESERITRALEGLQKDALVKRSGTKWRIA